MEAKNFRIGNLVKLNKFATNYEPNFIMKISGIGDDVSFSDGTTQIIKAIEPIILRQKHFKLFGFIKTDDDYFFFKEGVMIEVDDYIVEGLGDINVPLKYVHQLQNLFFALTGEELELVE